MKTITLKISNILGTDIRTRIRILELAQKTQGYDSSVLDFSGVAFISRSFADELITFSEAETPRKITFINVSEEIMSLLSIVKKGRNSRPAPQENGDIVSLDSMDDITYFFRDSQ